MRFRPLSARALLALLLAAVLAAAGDITIDDLVNLKKAGFSEAEVKREIARSGGAPAVGDADAKRLASAGFSAGFIESLRRSGATMSLDRVKAMTAAHESPAAIIDAIADSGASFAITPAQALDLSRAGVHATVLRVLRGGPLSRDEILDLVRAKTAAPALAAALRALGSSYRPNAAEALELLREEVPADVVKMLREGAAPRAAGGWRRFTHPTGELVVEYPPEWKTLVYPAEDELMMEYIFTPETDALDPEKVSRAATVSMIPVQPGSPFDAVDLPDCARRLRPLLLAKEPGLKARGDVRTGRIGGHDAVLFDFEGTLSDKTGKFRVGVGLARASKHPILGANAAPRAEYDAHPPS
jgi:hypothetical protein